MSQKSLSVQAKPRVVKQLAWQNKHWMLGRQLGSLEAWKGKLLWDLPGLEFGKNPATLGQACFWVQMWCAGFKWITKPKRIGYFMMMLVIVHFLYILPFGYHFLSLLNQISDLVSKLLSRNIARSAKSRINGQSCFSFLHKYTRYWTRAHIDCCFDFQLNIWQFGKLNTLVLIQQEST